MKPLLSGMQDSDELQDIGRASIQIVHDLKNQLNGLKLYATFLRRRLEKNDRPSDEQETVIKLIAGLERAAEDLSIIVRYSRPLELKKQPGVDIQKIMRNVCASLTENKSSTGSLLGPLLIDGEQESLVGEFDSTLLADAFRAISVGALKINRNNPNDQGIVIRFSKSAEATVVIEWSGLVRLDHDPFRSFIGSDEIRMSFAAKILEAHGGTAIYDDNVLRVRLPLAA